MLPHGLLRQSAVRHRTVHGRKRVLCLHRVQSIGFRLANCVDSYFSFAGILFTLMTVLRLRQWVVDGVPTSLRHSFAVGIGLFLTFIGLNETGLVVPGVKGAPVQAGHLLLSSGNSIFVGFSPFGHFRLF